MELLGIEGERLTRTRSFNPAPRDLPPFVRYEAYLSDPDRVLVDLYYRRRVARTEIARMVGKSLSAVCRRIDQLERRFRDPLVVALLEARDGEIAPLHRAIGISRFLGRRSVADIERVYSVSRWEVQRVIGYLGGWAVSRRSKE